MTDTDNTRNTPQLEELHPDMEFFDLPDPENLLPGNPFPALRAAFAPPENEIAPQGQGHTPWAVGQHPWPEQVGCGPLVGRPWSVHGTNNRNVAAAVSEDIARLIAAAPEMLEALQALMDLNDNGGPFGGEIYQDRIDRAWRSARAALAKATGGAA